MNRQLGTIPGHPGPENHAQGIDLIGDIHGHIEPLRDLLDKLGYVAKDGEGFQHPDGRQVVFLGDFIDRGPAIRETLQLVKVMADAGHALAVMGNHEYNAVCLHTPDGCGDFLRSRTTGDGKNVWQHQATLDAFRDHREEWQHWLAWFRQLPFALDLGGLRAVHATWDSAALGFLAGNTITNPAFLHASARRGSPEHRAVDAVLKGIEISLPEGHFFDDKQGFRRTQIRVRWWDQPDGKTFRNMVFPECDTVPDIPIDTGKIQSWEGYPETAPPVFFGHYWLPATADLMPVATNAACLDYSVAKPGGRLVAYRWDGEQILDPEHFISVP